MPKNQLRRRSHQLTSKVKAKGTVRSTGISKDIESFNGSGSNDLARSSSDKLILVVNTPPTIPSTVIVQPPQSSLLRHVNSLTLEEAERLKLFLVCEFSAPAITDSSSLTAFTRDKVPSASIG